MPYGESLMQLEALAEERARDAKFNAALHGRELR